MFKITDSATHTANLSYDDIHHIVVNSEGTPIFKDSSDIGIIGEALNKQVKPNIAKIKLGHQCNIGCSYCLQEPLGDKEAPKTKFKPELLMDLSEATRIELWGGEPLLFWRTIKEIVEYYDREDVIWAMTTNGTLLKPDHIKFMHNTKGRWALAMSHDGLHQKTLRDKNDPLDNFVVLNVFDMIRKSGRIDMMFNVTVSEQNWDVYETIRFLEPHGFPINFELITGYDANSLTHVVTDNRKKHRDSIFKVFKEMDSFKVDTSLTTFSLGIVPVAQNLKTRDQQTNTWGCGLSDDLMVSMDLGGNLIACQNTRESYGLATDPINADMSRVVDLSGRQSCIGCPVLRLCKGGCPLNDEPENCDIRFSHYTAVLEGALSLVFGQSMELITERPKY